MDRLPRLKTSERKPHLSCSSELFHFRLLLLDVMSPSSHDSLGEIDLVEDTAILLHVFFH